MEGCGVLTKLVTVMVVATILVSGASCDDAANEVPKYDRKLCFKVCLATCNNGFSPNCVPTCKNQCDLPVMDAIVSHIAADVMDADPESTDTAAARAPAPAPTEPPSGINAK